MLHDSSGNFILLVIIGILLSHCNGLIGDCIGCQRPAPPKCCPVTCPRCLPIDKRHRPEFRYRSSSLPVSVRSPAKKSRSRRPKLLKEPRKVLLDEQDFWKIDEWAVPRGSCEGPDCACANCVCCFTETVLFSTTTTCTATAFTTTFITSSFVTTFDVTEFVSQTNYINFTVTNTVEFLSTVSFFKTAARPISLTFSSVDTTTAVSSIFASVVTEFGAIGTSTSFLPQTETITELFTTRVSRTRTRSIPNLVTVDGTTVIPTSIFTSIVPYEIFKCNRSATFSVSDTKTVTATLLQTTTETPLVTFIDATASVTSTRTFTSTVTKCKGVETVKQTPTRTFIAGTIVPTKDAPSDNGCPVCVHA